MIHRILYGTVKNSPKGLILLGPRQVGKSTLAQLMGPELQINLADEEVFQKHSKDLGLLKRMVKAQSSKTLILIDEIQRIPSMLNTVQTLIDEDKARRFLLTGSSARKLKRGKANLIPGRIFWKHLSPLLYWELKGNFDLNRALTLGTLPEVYLEDYGPELLHSYTSTYLREEIQAEALTKDIGSYGRFLDLAAELSGQYVNYSKIASDSEISKDTIRRYFEILTDTLIVEKINSYTKVPKERKARQKERFIFFDMGVRNSIIGRTSVPLRKEEQGSLFEQWLILQVLYLNRTLNLNWKISSYRDSRALEVDLIVEMGENLMAIEIKSSTKLSSRMLKGLNGFEQLLGNKIKKYLVYQGEERQAFDCGCIGLPYSDFLDQLYSIGTSESR